MNRIEIKHGYVLQWGFIPRTVPKVGEVTEFELNFDNEDDANAKYDEIDQLEDLLYHRLYREGEYYLDGEPTGEFENYERLL